MAVLSGISAGQKMAAMGKVTPGTCLAVVWNAFGSPRSDGKGNGYQWATDALARAKAEGAIQGDNLDEAPEGAVLYWTNVIGVWARNGKMVKGDAGHVAIKGPNNTVITIDNPVRGRVGTVSVAAFKKKWPHLVFAGYAFGAGAFLGHSISTANTVVNKPNLPSKPAGESTGPIKEPEKDEAMTILLTSEKGQTLIIPGVGAVGMSPGDVKSLAVEYGPQYQLLRVSGALHDRILEASSAVQTNGDGVILFVAPVNGAGGGYWLLSGGRTSWIQKMETVQQFEKAGFPVVKVSQAELDSYNKSFSK